MLKKIYGPWMKSIPFLVILGAVSPVQGAHAASPSSGKIVPAELPKQCLSLAENRFSMVAHGKNLIILDKENGRIGTFSQENGSLLRSITPTGKPIGMKISQDGKFLYLIESVYEAPILNIINSTSLKTISQERLNMDVGGFFPSSDGTGLVIYSASRGNFVRYDLTTHKSTLLLSDDEPVYSAIADISKDAFIVSFTSGRTLEVNSGRPKIVEIQGEKSQRFFSQSFASSEDKLLGISAKGVVIRDSASPDKVLSHFDFGGGMDGINLEDGTISKSGKYSVLEGFISFGMTVGNGTSDEQSTELLHIPGGIFLMKTTRHGNQIVLPIGVGISPISNSLISEDGENAFIIVYDDIKNEPTLVSINLATENIVRETGLEDFMKPRNRNSIVYEYCFP